MSRGSLALWGSAGALLLIPVVAMRFTEEVAWTAFDFATAAVMLGAVCLGVELAFRRTLNGAYRAGAALALAAAFLLFWVTGAVGIIGSERDAPNLLFGAVLVTALLGVLVARFRPAGMAWAMGAAALVQALVPVVTAVAMPQYRAPLMAPEVAGSTVVFVAVWLGSAWLFHRAARAT